MPPTLPPYALAAPSFHFRHLAILAGRAPIGGAREVALACFVAARLANECTHEVGEDRDARVARCAGAKAWLGTLALPAAIRTPVIRCCELSVEGGAAQVGKEIVALSAAATSYLDAASRAELAVLSSALRS
ncbi:MAG: hypothetical protein ABJE10_23410 [bacterium]